MKKKKWPFIYVAVITILTYIPILLTVVYSFNASKLTSVWEGFSLKWYRELFRDRDLGEALINSLILAVLSCTFAVLIGTSGALGMSRRKRKLNEAVAYVSTLPIMIPEIILGMVFLSVFSLMGLPFIRMPASSQTSMKPEKERSKCVQRPSLKKETMAVQTL